MKVHTAEFQANLAGGRLGNFKAVITEGGMDLVNVKIYRKYDGDNKEYLQNTSGGDLVDTVDQAKRFVRQFVPDIVGRLKYTTTEK